MSTVADAAGFIAVYPRGFGRRRPRGRPRILAPRTRGAGTRADAVAPRRSSRVDDVGFVDAMLADWGARVCVDTKRIYAPACPPGRFSPTGWPASAGAVPRRHRPRGRHGGPRPLLARARRVGHPLPRHRGHQTSLTTAAPSPSGAAPAASSRSRPGPAQLVQPTRSYRRTTGDSTCLTTTGCGQNADRDPRTPGTGRWPHLARRALPPGKVSATPRRTWTPRTRPGRFFQMHSPTLRSTLSQRERKYARAGER